MQEESSEVLNSKLNTNINSDKNPIQNIFAVFYDFLNVLKQFFTPVF